VFTVSLCSLKGGVGKTSVTLGLASAALRRGVPTLVVDMDPQGDSTLGLLGTAVTGPDVSDVLDSPKQDIVRAALRPVPWAEGSSVRLDVLPGSHRSSAHDSPQPRPRTITRVAEALEAAGAADTYELVLIDCPPSLNGLTQMALTASDGAAVISEPGIFAVAAADRALTLVRELREQGYAPRLAPSGIIVNRYRPRSVEHRYRLEELRELYGDMVLSPVVEERVGLQQAQGASIPLHRYEGASGSVLSETFDALLRRLVADHDVVLPALVD
jgi:chromosome partitioning protein